MIEVKCSHTAMVPLSELRPHVKNNNKHPEKQIEVLAKLIQDLGMRSPIVVSNRSGMIVKGNGRLEALQLLGVDSAPVDYQDYDSDIDELRDLTADNRIASYAEFDLQAFDMSLKDLDLNFNEIDMETFGIIDVPIDFIETEKDDVDKEEPEEKLQIVIKCADQDEMECLTFEFQSKGLSFEVKR